MFTNILFLILALLLINTVPEDVIPWITSEWMAFSTSILLYIGLCGVIFIQYLILKGFFGQRPGIIQIIVNIELLIYLIIYQYVLDAGRLFQSIPYMQNVQSLNSTWKLLLYLGGLATYYSSTFVRFYSYNHSESRQSYTFRQLSLLIPFAIPFILVTLVLDIFNIALGSNPVNSELFDMISIIFSLGAAILMMIFLPYFIQKIWKCRPLPEGELKNRLENFCREAKFKHAGMKTWTIMHDQLTAGIIGIVPRFRYVMFTDRLLRELPSDSIEAILAHEIGHNARKHLLIYPFILAGMIICSGLFYHFFSAPLLNILEQENAQHPSILWDFFNPLLIFSLYAGIIILYFRLVFGYYSRIFERQADLHIFELGLHAQPMIAALEKVAQTSGGYDTPNWHHYSIKQRIDFLRACEINPDLIRIHHRKVRLSVGIYFILFILASGVLIYVTP